MLRPSLTPRLAPSWLTEVMLREETVMPTSVLRRWARPPGELEMWLM